MTKIKIFFYIFKYNKLQAVQCCAYSHDGRYIASGGADGMLCIWLAAKADCIRSLDHYEKWIFDVIWHNSI